MTAEGRKSTRREAARAGARMNETPAHAWFNAGAEGASAGAVSMSTSGSSVRASISLLPGIDARVSRRSDLDHRRRPAGRIQIGPEPVILVDHHLLARPEMCTPSAWYRESCLVH